MPLYEYECTACHRRTEKIQKFSDPELTVCPFCAGPLERTLTAPAVHFAGGGWYKDLYSSAKPPAAASGDGKSEGAASGSSDAPAASGSSAGEGASAPGQSAAPAAAPAAAPSVSSAPAPSAPKSGS